MITGSLFFFDLIFTPKIFRGFIILEKSLFERLLSPLIMTDLFELDRARVSAEGTQRLIDAVSNIRLPDLTVRRR